MLLAVVIIGGLLVLFLLDGRRTEQLEPQRCPTCGAPRSFRNGWITSSCDNPYCGEEEQ